MIEAASAEMLKEKACRLLISDIRDSRHGYADAEEH
jgi:hypothetical protein